MTSEELLEQIKADANAELYGNVDEPEEDSNKINEQNTKRLKSDFRKFTNLIKKLKKIKSTMREMEYKYTDNDPNYEIRWADESILDLQKN